MTAQLVTELALPNPPQSLYDNPNHNLHKFTTEQYQLMCERGVFPPDDRYELINGEIRKMSPIGIKHAVCVTRLSTLLTSRFINKAIVWAQNPISINEYSQPQPDIALLKWRDDFYANGLPTPADILLIIEVADSTIAYDREIKTPLYAASGIPEMWLCDINQRIIMGHTQPSGSGYKRIQRYESGDTLSLIAFPEVIFNWEALF
jgi:Uma2 family endonuclease